MGKRERKDHVEAYVINNVVIPADSTLELEVTKIMEQDWQAMKDIEKEAYNDGVNSLSPWARFLDDKRTRRIQKGKRQGKNFCTIKYWGTKTGDTCYMLWRQLKESDKQSYVDAFEAGLKSQNMSMQPKHLMLEDAEEKAVMTPQESNDNSSESGPDKTISNSMSDKASKSDDLLEWLVCQKCPKRFWAGNNQPTLDTACKEFQTHLIATHRTYVSTNKLKLEWCKITKTPEKGPSHESIPANPSQNQQKTPNQKKNPNP